MSDPFVSVVIPVWNRPYFVAMCIESVLAQTYSDFELIVVDDGSTDNTVEVVEQYAEEDPRIRVIEKEHSGTTDTFNRGMAEMGGDAFCLLGSDDLWMPTKLEKQVHLATKNPGHVIHTEAVHMSVHGELLRPSMLLKELGGTTPDLFRARCLHPYAAFFGSSLYVPRTVLDRVGPFLAATICEDYHWVLRAALLFDIPFTLVPGHLIMKRANAQSISGEQHEFILKEAESMRQAVLTEMEVRCKK